MESAEKKRCKCRFHDEIVNEELLNLAHRVCVARDRLGLDSAHNLSKTTCGLSERVGNFERARRCYASDRNGDDYITMIRALVDVMIFSLAGLRMLECSDILEAIDMRVSRIEQLGIGSPH